MNEPTADRGRRLPFAFTSLDPDIHREIVHFDASDSAQSWGVLYLPPGHTPHTAVYLMHPRGDFSRHYVVPGLAARGYAVFGHNSRYLNNDTDMVHERLLLDIAAGIRELRARGFDRIVLLGNSGGGSLLSFYQSQAGRAPAERFMTSPGGDPVPLPDEVMPPGDLYIAVAAHPGEGRFLLNVLDPSVADEMDPASHDPDWDMFNPANGYRPWPEPSRYDRTWLAAYRDQQRERARRLDAIARSYLAERRMFRNMAADESLDDATRRDARRRGLLWRYMVIYRTLANPAHLDLTIDPNERSRGSIFSPGDPMIGNYGPGGLARVLTPRAWLSTWSGLSSQAELPDTIRDVTVPTLIVYPAADSDIYPSEQREFFEQSGAEDKQFVELPGANHYLFPAGERGEELPDPRERLLDVIVPWIEERLGGP